ncbi:hypothetical protein Leryth_006704, partial [Lithospermum erythrorhizon]
MMLGRDIFESKDEQSHAKTIKLRPSILYSGRGPDCSITLLADWPQYGVLKSGVVFPY